MSSLSLPKTEETGRRLAAVYAPIAAGAGRGRADLRGRAGQPVPVRAAPGGPQRRLPRQAAAPCAGPADRQGLRRDRPGAPGPGGRRRDDPHRHPGPRRHPRRGGDPPARGDGQRRVGQRDGRPAGRLPLHARLPPGRLAGVDPGLPADRPRDQPGLRRGDAAGPQPRQLRPRRGRLLRDHPGQDRRADRRLLPPGGPLRRRPPRPRPRRSRPTGATWASPSRSPTTSWTSGATSGPRARASGPTWRSRS